MIQTSLVKIQSVISYIFHTFNRYEELNGTEVTGVEEGLQIYKAVGRGSTKVPQVDLNPPGLTKARHNTCIIELSAGRATQIKGSKPFLVSLDRSMW